MAVASFHQNGRQVAMRNFHPPKQATMRHWYKAATAQIDDAPDWRAVDMGAAVVDEDTIRYIGRTNGLPWDLFIARKRNLR